MEKAVYRILDANFNRAREALRVMEDFCRFGLNDAALSGRVKEVRHKLCGYISQLETSKLLCSRDSQGDVGRNLKVRGQLERLSLGDCFTAAAKRLPEALRTMAEAAQTFDPELADRIESLRFEAYTLEKSIYLAQQGREKFRPVRLYVLIDVDNQKQDAEVLNLAGRCVKGGADCLQLRAKGVSDMRFLSLACRFAELCNDAGIISIINDRPDIALMSKADGVHLGQEDLPAEQVRRLADRPVIVGVSTHSMEQLEAAIAAGCDYVGIGPVFDSPTKTGVAPAGLEYVCQAIERLKNHSIGTVAIGGICLENIRQVLDTGARTIAICSAISKASDVEQTCRQLKEYILKYPE